MKYKAFISYKQISITRFAENLELAIKAYAKPNLAPADERVSGREVLATRG